MPVDLGHDALFGRVGADEAYVAGSGDGMSFGFGELQRIVSFSRTLSGGIPGHRVRIADDQARGGRQADRPLGGQVRTMPVAGNEDTVRSAPTALPPNGSR